MFLRIVSILLASLALASPVQAQLTRIVVTYAGPFGTLPGTGSGSMYATSLQRHGPSWSQYMLPFTNQVNGHYEFYTNATLAYITDVNGWGGTWPLEHSGTPDYILIEIDGTVQFGSVMVWRGRVYKYKNGVMMHASPPPLYRSHLQHPSGGALPPLP
jgi:hypothetical protein